MSDLEQPNETEQRGFWARFLPPSERRVTLWLVLGFAVISLVASAVEHQAATALEQVSEPLGAAMAWGIRGTAQAAIAAVLVALVIRFAKAPRVLALFGALGSLASAALEMVSMSAFALKGGVGGVGNLTVSSMITPVVGDVALAVGAVAGAWIAGTVTVNRVRNLGLDAAELDEDERPEPTPRGFSFLGWEGRPTVGDARVALALVTVLALAKLANTVVLLPVAFVSTERLAELAWLTPLSLGVGMLVWALAARFVARRFGVFSVWLLPVASLIPAVWFAIAQIRFDVGSGLIVLLTNIAPGVLVAVAALIGVATALPPRVATLMTAREAAPDTHPEPLEDDTPFDAPRVDAETDAPGDSDD